MPSGWGGAVRPAGIERSLLRGGETGEAKWDGGVGRVVDGHDAPVRVPSRAEHLCIERGCRGPERRVERITGTVDRQRSRVRIERVFLDVAPPAGFVAGFVAVAPGGRELCAGDADGGSRAGLIREIRQRTDDAFRQLQRILGVEKLAAAVDRPVPEVVDCFGSGRVEDRCWRAGLRYGPIPGTGGHVIDAARIGKTALGADRQAIHRHVLPRRDSVPDPVFERGANVADPVVHREIAQRVAGLLGPSK